MANNNSSFPSTPTKNQPESPFTASEFDLFPPLPNLMSDDPYEFAPNPDNDMMAKYAQLQQESDQIKAELVEIRSQRQGEQDAYGSFIKSVETVNAHLPPQAKTPALRMSLRNLVETSHAYRNQAHALNQRYSQIQGLLPAVSPVRNTLPQSAYSASITPPQPSLRQRFAQDPSISHSPQPSTPYFPHPSLATLRHQGTINAIRNTLEQLQISCPRDSKSFEVALGHLKNNIESFAPFIVLYLNGRYKHVTSKLRPLVDAEISGFFDDPEDAKVVVSNVVKILRENVKYVEQDVQGIGSDVIGPMGLVLWALVGLLEKDQC